MLLLALQIHSLSAFTSGSAYQLSLTFVLLSWRSSTHSWCSRKRGLLCSEQQSSSPLVTLSTLFGFFFFPFGCATRHVESSSAMGAERPLDTQGRPSTGVYQGPSPAFLMSWFAFGESRKSHSSRVFTAAGIFSRLLPGNTWHFMVLSLPILKARHAGRADLWQIGAAQRCLNKADKVQFAGRF